MTRFVAWRCPRRGCGHINENVRCSRDGQPLIYVSPRQAKCSREGRHTSIMTCRRCGWRSDKGEWIPM
jgi:hypothetical protein